MEASAQWADSLLGLERLLLLKVAIWGALSVVLGTALLAFGRLSPPRSAMLASFGGALMVLGIAELAFALVARESVGLRDLHSATRLDRALWLVAGLAIAWSTAALALAIQTLRARPPRARPAGAMIAVALHGAAIALLALQLGSALVR